MQDAAQYQAYAGGGRFQVYALPPGPHSARTVHIALRVWHYPGWALSYGGGPANGGGLVGDTIAINRQQNSSAPGSTGG